MNYLVFLFFAFNNLFFFNYSHALEKKRIDIDLRLSPKNNKSFLDKINFFNDKKVISILNEDLSITSSRSEFFTDTYFDNNSLKLSDASSSLRFRTRYKENKLISKLVQFKRKSLSENNAYSEEKIDLSKETVNIFFPDQLKQFLIAKDQKNSVVRSIKKHIKLSEINPIFQVTQIRDRFYLLGNDNKVKFTISFDKSYYKNGMDTLPHQVVELEISEKLLQKANQIETLFLKKQLLKILEIFDEGFFAQQSTKYEMGIKLLKIEKKFLNPINTILAIFIFLTSAIVVFRIFYKGKKYG